MNLPNKLTVLRLILVPFFVFFLLMPSIPHHFLAAFVIFAAASYTDHLDGKIARKRNMVTDFGKFADPLADKILVFSAIACFIQLGLTSAPVLIITAGNVRPPCCFEQGKGGCRKYLRKDKDRQPDDRNSRDNAASIHIRTRKVRCHQLFGSLRRILLVLCNGRDTALDIRSVHHNFWYRLCCPEF